MRTTLLIAFLVTLISSQTFDQWCVRLDKRYDTPELRAKAEKAFNQNVNKINEHNADPNRTYDMKINEYSDLTPEQTAEKLGLKPLRLIHSQNPQKPKSAHKVLQGSAVGAVPASVDWRTEGKVTAVKNQGTCGSCWAFATTAVFEANYQIMGGTMPSGREPDFSEEYALECTTANSPGGTVSSCGGGIVEYALPFLIRDGMPTETDFPYTAGSWPINTAGTPTTTGICSTTNLYKEPTNTIAYNGNYENLTNTEMKDIIAYGPVTAAMYAGGTFMTYSGGIYNGCPNFATSVGTINHAVVIVGYDASGNYIIKNSWGTTWGENGYAIISKDADCGISHIPREIRGNNVQLSYERTIYLVLVLFLAFFLI